jgi:hypothetical protein
VSGQDGRFGTCANVQRGLRCLGQTRARRRIVLREQPPRANPESNPSVAAPATDLPLRAKVWDGRELEQARREVGERVRDEEKVGEYGGDGVDTPIEEARLRECVREDERAPRLIALDCARGKDGERRVDAVTR